MQLADANPARSQREQRETCRGPYASSFVPGLVHEMRNFIFGITASLDAFHARFGQQQGVEVYESVIRSSVDRLNGFVDELRDFGDTTELSWAEGNLELLLREAIEQVRPRTAAELRLLLAGPLPPIRADEQSLCMAFTRMLGLALGPAGNSGPVTVHAAPGRQGDDPVIVGHVDCPRLDLRGLDPARLFEPFYFRIEGFGRLALPVVRRILENHGGRLSAAALAGGGVRLSFTLPALQAVS